MSFYFDTLRALIFMYDEIFDQIKVRQVKYLNNLIEQAHQFKKNNKTNHGL